MDDQKLQTIVSALDADTALCTPQTILSAWNAICQIRDWRQSPNVTEAASTSPGMDAYGQLVHRIMAWHNILRHGQHRTGLPEHRWRNMREMTWSVDLESDDTIDCITTEAVLILLQVNPLPSQRASVLQNIPNMARTLLANWAVLAKRSLHSADSSTAHRSAWMFTSLADVLSGSASKNLILSSIKVQPNNTTPALDVLISEFNAVIIISTTADFLPAWIASGALTAAADTIASLCRFVSGDNLFRSEDKLSEILPHIMAIFKRLLHSTGPPGETRLWRLTVATRLTEDLSQLVNPEMLQASGLDSAQFVDAFDSVPLLEMVDQLADYYESGLFPNPGAATMWCNKLLEVLDLLHQHLPLQISGQYPVLLCLEETFEEPPEVGWNYVKNPGDYPREVKRKFRDLESAVQATRAAIDAQVQEQ